jgi:hypothetical protein
MFMECFAQETIREFMNYNPFEDDDCFECTQKGGQCQNCHLAKIITPTPKYKYESETSKAVRQIVNGCKLYPKALTMQYDNEVKYDKERAHKKNKFNSPPPSISAMVPVDQTLSFGDWKILEPGNFGTQPHFLDGYLKPAVVPNEANVVENNYYRTQSTLSVDTCSDDDESSPEV